MTERSLAVLKPPVANFHQYVGVVESFPMLSAEEERELAQRWQQTRDMRAAWRLVTSHLRYVVEIARGYRGYGLPTEDLVQEGNIGLMRAVYRFDPTRGARLLTYATHWIRAYIHEFILRNWRIVKIATTRAKRKLFFNLRRAKARLGHVSADEASMIASALDVRPRDVVEVDAAFVARDHSLDAPLDPADDGGESLDAFLADESIDVEESVAERDFHARARANLDAALASLDDRGRTIIARRWLVEDHEKWTLARLAEELGVSIERVRQLEAAALRRLRETLAPRLGVDATH